MDKIHNIIQIPIHLIEVNEWNPNYMERKAFERLLHEIKVSGFISAIQVVPLDNGKYRVIGGEHRLRAARELKYDTIPCVVLSDAKFKDVDLQKFLTVKLNVLTGHLDPEKFRVLYEEMVDKYGADSLEDLFGFTDEEQWQSIIKNIRRELRDAGISKKQVDKAIKEIEQEGIDGISAVLNKIFSQNGDMLKNNGFMKFEFNGSPMIYFEVDKEVFSFFDDLQLNTDPKIIDNKILEIFEKLNSEFNNAI